MLTASFDMVVISLVTVVVCGVLEQWLPWPERYHPLAFIRLLSLRLTDKVCHPQRPRSQQYTACVLAMLCLFAPLLLLLWLVVQMADYPVLFEGLWLLIALRFKHSLNVARRVQQALVRQHKLLARETLSHLVCRDTQSLSPVGMVKATNETLFIRVCYQQLTPILLFLLGGGLLALSYRMLLEFHYVANPKQPRFAVFGKPLAVSLSVLNWVSAKILAATLLIISHPVHLFRHANYLIGSNRKVIVQCAAAAMRIQLGGPAMYPRGKYRFARFGHRSPTPNDIPRAIRFVGLARVGLSCPLLLVASMLLLGG